ncbi:homocysteine S-methyltransferase family protein [Mogibacterium sp. BX12]|uniref:Methionine synthase n=2 Tax=Zhenpiania hominis TaxID=2763644 RepID=A0A923NLZ4_9FIRM|nr:homocysteine S-methyltransferase family protein [Zhenpiania hominis]
MGTMLQAYGLEPGEPPALLAVTNPELITSIHRQYVEAGADILYANTFGTNRYKLEGYGYSPGQIIDSAIKAARAACKEDTLVALDVDPLGELLEPMGTLTFEEAYDAFCEVVKQGEASGADLIVIETMTDLYEVKAAVLAAKEQTNLPVMVSMTFEETGRTFTGTSIECMTAVLEGLGVDAVGINCSLGPVEIFPLAEKMCQLTDLPVFVKPNAGLPDPRTGAYTIGPEEFARAMAEYRHLGIAMAGGCCGTTPDYIARMKAVFAGMERKQRTPSARESCVCSATNCAAIDHVTVIGERINPTGKKRLKQALIEEDYDYLLSQAVQQADAGAQVLDVNVGIPDIEEARVLPAVVKKIQAVTDLPLQIDSSDPAAIEAALRVYNGKAIVNSVNGEEKSLSSILPVVKKYGAAVVGLTLDENGIPSKAEDRLAIAGRILKRAMDLGIPKKDVFIDCLTLTASAQQAEVKETLKAVRMVKEELGLHTVLGVSNISFGLPCRPLVNRTFLALAMENGLDLPIINPNDEDMMGTIFAFEMLHNRDENAQNFIERYRDVSLGTMTRGNDDSGTPSGGKPEGTENELFHALEKGMKGETVHAVQKLLETKDEMAVVNDYLIPALDKVGQGFEKGTIFLPQMMQAATAAQGGFEVIKERLAASGKAGVSKGQVVIATVKGDIHDIGKNIVKVIMENYGFEMIDLGRDVPAETIVNTVVEKNIQLVGLSALMTTTLKSMEETIAAVRAAAPDCKFLVGGAVLTPDYAEKIGADYYCKDAMKSVEAAKEVFGV